ncbi:hypothetical protein DESUT3_29590 [Desulfuromonas versatilis]|uniref:CHRD domain-containing protein n=1 Tax=Desulfuromonas versatilis TaxID=2802975 RepID=A0ABN6E0Q0_9BACT|nr:CHRD domain-containing protein [Desulfuromonas versatilis]BCR05890.1 hypothetical protein DESUT3_29590 [Desulfuromonas versatilis]
MLIITRKLFVAGVFALSGLLAAPQAVWADLAAVGPINLQNGFPLWWQDQNGTQVEICLEAANCPLFDPPVPGNPYSQQIGFGAEAFWWAAGADLANPVGNGLFELAMEAAFLTEDPAPGDQNPFVRLRARFDVAVAGTYTITYPFGTLTVNVPAGDLVINETIDIAGSPGDLPPFSAALATGVPPVAADGANNGVSAFFSGLAPAPAAGFMGVPGIASTIDATGLVNGATVTITGPAGAFGATNTLTNNDLWDVAGKLFIPGVNLAPNAVPDFATTALGSPVTINVVANDVDTLVAGSNDHVINPLAVALGSDTVNLINNAIGATSSVATARGGSATINADGTITYVPPPTFSGADSFSYLVQDTGGLVDTAQVTVVVEQLGAASAELRTKLLKWDIEGNSTITRLSGIDGAGNTFFFTPLAGLWNTPLMAASTGSGSITLTVIRDGAGTVTDLDYTLQIDGLVDITAAHIHVGALGERGPITVTLFDADGDIGTVGVPAGTNSPLTVTPATRFPAGDPRNTTTVTDVDNPVGGPLANLTAVVDAILAGQAYIQVHTVANPPGEIRGQLGRNAVALRAGSNSGPVIGTAAVTGTGTSGLWRFSGKSVANPGTSTQVFVLSSAGSAQAIPLRLR